MTQLEIIRRPIAEEFEHFQRMFSNFADTDNPLLREVINHIVQRKGKQMRPALTLLFAKLYGGVGEATYNAALSLELLHTASLLHDDVVDNSLTRRGQRSVNAIYGNQVSVLVGDFVLATSLTYMSHTENGEMAKVVAELAQALSDGELYQLLQSHENIVSEEVYFHIIKKKTAALFSACAQLGAMSADATPEEVEKAAKFGEFIGICFQIRDDIFDYFDSAEIGKPTGNDMREGKLTLPAIYALKNHADQRMLDMVEELKSGSLSDEGITELIEFAKANGGIEYAHQVMEDYRAQALQLLPEIADPEVLNAIIAHMDYVIGRNN